MVTLAMACAAHVARAEPSWSWSFSEQTVALPYEGLLYAQFSNDPTSSEDLFLGGAQVGELPEGGSFFVPELGTRIVFTALPNSSVLQPGQSVTLPLYSIVLANPAAKSISDGAYGLRPAYSGLFGAGSTPTSRLAERPLTLTVSAIPESGTFNLLLAGLLALAASFRTWKPSL